MNNQLLNQDFAKNLKIQIEMINVYRDMICYGTQNDKLDNVFPDVHLNYKELLVCLDSAFAFIVIVRLVDLFTDSNTHNPQYNFPSWIKNIECSLPKSKITNLPIIRSKLDDIVRSKNFVYLEKLRSKSMAHLERNSKIIPQPAEVGQCIQEAEEMHNQLCTLCGYDEHVISYATYKQNGAYKVMRGEMLANQLMLALSDATNSSN